MKTDEIKELNNSLNKYKYEYDTRKTEWTKKIVSLQVELQCTKKEIENLMQEHVNFKRHSEEDQSRADQHFEEKLNAQRREYDRMAAQKEAELQQKEKSWGYKEQQLLVQISHSERRIEDLQHEYDICKRALETLRAEHNDLKRRSDLKYDDMVARRLAEVQALKHHHELQVQHMCTQHEELLQQRVEMWRMAEKQREDTLTQLEILRVSQGVPIEPSSAPLEDLIKNLQDKLLRYYSLGDKYEASVTRVRELELTVEDLRKSESALASAKGALSIELESARDRMSALTPQIEKLKMDLRTTEQNWNEEREKLWAQNKRLLLDGGSDLTANDTKKSKYDNKEDKKEMEKEKAMLQAKVSKLEEELARLKKEAGAADRAVAAAREKNKELAKSQVVGLRSTIFDTNSL